MSFHLKANLHIRPIQLRTSAVPVLKGAPLMIFHSLGPIHIRIRFTYLCSEENKPGNKGLLFVGPTWEATLSFQNERRFLVDRCGRPSSPR